MTNKTTLYLIGLSLIAVLIGLMINLQNPTNILGEITTSVGHGIAQLLGIFMLLRNGTLKRTVYFRIIKVCIGLTLIGVLLVIRHLPGAYLLLFISLISIALTYLVWFFAKTKKGHLDILKLLWVLAAFIGTPLVMQHTAPYEITYLAHGLFWLTFIDFIMIKIKAKTLFDS